MRVGLSSRLFTAISRSRAAQLRPHAFLPSVQIYRHFQTSPIHQKLQNHVLSDIGEGVKEVQIIQWFIEEGAAVEEWAPLCEVQSDKASVEITSKYTGVVKKLHFKQDDVVQVGDVMLDIDVEGDQGAEEDSPQETVETVETESKEAEETAHEEQTPEVKDQDTPDTKSSNVKNEPEPEKQPAKHAGLATPAVRELLKQHGLDITDIEGTGKDGRVLKEDVQNHVKDSKASSKATTIAEPTKPNLDSKQVETTKNLTPVQSAMFKSMTKSLSIPHFLYSDSINITALVAMRTKLNAARDSESMPKLSYLPFVVKAVSLALNRYPILNARLDTTEPSKPKLQMRQNHNIGIAMDTPAGLLVPVIRSVNARSIVSIAQELQRLSQLGQAGKLSNEDLSGGTITVSNIGSIGGETVGPVIVEGQLAIMGIGKIKPTPVFAADGKTVERADLMSTSWSADHRVIDGATMARIATVVQGYLEHPEKMMIDMS